MAESNRNGLVTKIATYSSFIAAASSVILFISIFLKFSFNIEFTATIMNVCRYTLILGFILMSLPDVVDRNIKKIIFDAFVIIVFIFFSLQQFCFVIIQLIMFVSYRIPVCTKDYSNRKQQ